jgi:lipopolysaccharide biosynthesis protein
VKRLCLLAGYSETNTIEDYVVYYAQSLARYADVYYLADNDLPESEMRKLDAFVKGRWAVRHKKYDFGSWQELIRKLGWSQLEGYASLILTNDSNYGPVRDLSSLFETMDQSGFDFWGVTKNNGVFPHLQSYFLNFYKNVFSRGDFRRFFESVCEETSKVDVCVKYEIGLTKLLHLQGLSYGAYIDRDKLDVPFGADISCFQNTIIRVGSPFLKRKVFFVESFPEESVSETWELLKKLNYPTSLIRSNNHNMGQGSDVETRTRPGAVDSLLTPSLPGKGGTAGGSLRRLLQKVRARIFDTHP